MAQPIARRALVLAIVPLIAADAGAQVTHPYAGKGFSGTLGSGNYTVSVRIRFDSSATTATMSQTVRRQGTVREVAAESYRVVAKGDDLSFTSSGGTEYLVFKGVFSPQLKTSGPGGQWSCALTEE